MRELTLNPSELIDQLEGLAAWAENIVYNNESTEIDEDCNPIGKNYSQETLETFAAINAHANLLRVLTRNSFLLWQGDFTEEQMHHAIDEDLNKLQAENE